MYQHIMSDASFTREQNKSIRARRARNLKEQTHQQKLAIRREKERLKQEKLQYTEPLLHFLQTKYPNILAEYNLFHSNIVQETGKTRNILHTQQMQKWLEETRPVERPVAIDINEALSVPKIEISKYQGPKKFIISEGRIWSRPDVETVVVNSSHDTEALGHGNDGGGIQGDTDKGIGIDEILEHSNDQHGIHNDENMNIDIDDIFTTINFDEILNLDINFEDYLV